MFKAVLSHNELLNAESNNFFYDVPFPDFHTSVSIFLQASFFIAYVTTSGWTSTSSDLFRIFQFIKSILRKCCCCNRNIPDKFDLPYIYYHREIPRILFFGLLGITYFFLAPLILPFLLVYFFLAYIIYKNQVTSDLGSFLTNHLLYIPGEFLISEEDSIEANDCEVVVQVVCLISNILHYELFE